MRWVFYLRLDVRLMLNSVRASVMLTEAEMKSSKAVTLFMDVSVWCQMNRMLITDTIFRENEYYYDNSAKMLGWQLYFYSECNLHFSFILNNYFLSRSLEMQIFQLNFCLRQTEAVLLNSVTSKMFYCLKLWPCLMFLLSQCLHQQFYWNHISQSDPV